MVYSKQEYKPVPDVSTKEPGVDPYLATLAREQRAREQLVAIAELKILEEKVKECYVKEGVNHYVNCQRLTREYFKRVARPDLTMTAPVEMSDINQ